MFIRMLQFLAQAIPFILLCLAARKANLNKIDRGRRRAHQTRRGADRG